MSEKKEEKTGGIIAELGYTALTEEERNELTATAARTLEDRVTLAILEVLTEDEQKELAKLIDRDDKEIMDWLTKKIPGLGAIIHAEYLDMVEGMKRDKAKTEEAIRDYQRQMAKKYNDK